MLHREAKHYFMTMKIFALDVHKSVQCVSKGFDVHCEAIIFPFLFGVLK